MIKYVDTLVGFAEVPSEISLCINISGCIIQCKDCHSKHLWEDIGEPLDVPTLQNLLDNNKGITCVCILGGHDFTALNELFKYVKEQGLKTCWYTGYDCIPKDINLAYLDYIKIGHYDGHPLNDPKTNQKFYIIESEHIDGKITKFKRLEDITYVFWKSDKS